MALTDAEKQDIIDGVLDTDHRIYAIQGTASGDITLDEGDTLTLVFTPSSVETVSTSLARLTPARAAALDLLYDIFAKTQLIGGSGQTTSLASTAPKYDVQMFVGETQAKSIPSADYTAVDIEVVFQSLNNETDIAIISNASITKTTTAVSFSMPAKVRKSEATYIYAVRRVSNAEVLIYGIWEVKVAARRS